MRAHFEMTELSRGELLSWVNDLTSLNLPKVESMGTGAAHCLIMNSIYGDLPVHKVNFRALHEYEYVQNFKVLQEAFVRHRIDRTIPVERLIKLKFQDNLEFLQWMKRYWDTHYTGENGANSGINITAATNTSAAARQPSGVSGSNKINRSASMKLSSITNTNTPTQSAPIQNTTIPNTSAANTASIATSNFQLAALTKTITELKLSVDEMEKERDFYFNKLRDIEILTQKVNEPTISSSVFFKQITEILYTTEDGFEIPQDSTGNNKTESSSVMTH